jgi:hemoglobin
VLARSQGRPFDVQAPSRRVEVGLARDERLRRALRDYFAWATTTTMSRYHHSAEDVPDGLHIPKWSWDGRVG